MIVILKPNVTEAQVQHVLERVQSLGLQAHLSRGTYRTIIGIIGDEEKLQFEPLLALPGVNDVIPVLPPYKLASREAHPRSSIVDVAGVKIGGPHLALIAGPCAVESSDQMHRIARAVKQAGAHILRGGAYKPRTSPYSFQGLEGEGLKILREAGDANQMPVVTEVTDPRCVELIDRYADMLQVGARNMQNFVLLKEVGKVRKPVLLKRGMSATVTDLLMSAEYVLSQGNSQVVLCERGVRGFDTKIARNLFDVATVAAVQQLSHLPIIVDPSHATGQPHLIPPCALAGVAAGADGVHIEVHDRPEEAKSDGAQSLRPEQFASLVVQIRRLAELMGKTVLTTEGTAS
ncbi:MAG: 3-deoxy-7-phosphoheptulonate synthase [Pirellulaceae bacterium]